MRIFVTGSDYVMDIVIINMLYIDTVMLSWPKVMTDKSQQVFNAAAQVVTSTNRFDDGLSQLLHTELHWLDVPERVLYMMFSCLHGRAPQYLMDFCQLFSDVVLQ